jgi:hypothetical protein
MHNICMIIRFTTSDWPFFEGWKAMDLVILVSSNGQRLEKTVMRNQLSQSNKMVYGIPKCTQTH